MEEKAIQSESPKRTLYNEEDVQGILKRAVALQTKTFTREQLEEMADELGITTELLEVAEEAWFKENKEQEVRQEFISHRQRGSRKNLAILGTVFGITVMMIFMATLFNVACLGFVSLFFAMILLFVGLGEAHQAYQAYFVLEGDEFEEQFDGWLERQKKKQERIEERREKLQS